MYFALFLAHPVQQVHFFLFQSIVGNAFGLSESSRLNKRYREISDLQHMAAPEDEEEAENGLLGKAAKNINERFFSQPDVSKVANGSKGGSNRARSQTNMTRYEGQEANNWPLKAGDLVYRVAQKKRSPRQVQAFPHFLELVGFQWLNLICE